MSRTRNYLVFTQSFWLWFSYQVAWKVLTARYQKNLSPAIRGSRRRSGSRWHLLPFEICLIHISNDVMIFLVSQSLSLFPHSCECGLQSYRARSQSYWGSHVKSTRYIDPFSSLMARHQILPSLISGLIALSNCLIRRKSYMVGMKCWN